MLPYSRGLILDNSNNYGIVKTETLIGFGPSNHDNFNRINSSESLEWILTHNNFAPRSLQGCDLSFTLLVRFINVNLYSYILSTTPIATNLGGQERQEFEVRVTTPAPQKKPKRSKKKTATKQIPKKQQSKSKRKGKVKKCIVKFLNKGEKYDKKLKKRGSKFHKLQKRYILPLILGLLAAKSLLIPIALKALAFLSAKGLIMGFFSTVMASVLSLKGMFDHSHGSQNRKDDTKTQVEIIQVPAKTEEHYYDDHHYRRGDYVPVYVSPA